MSDWHKIEVGEEWEFPLRTGPSRAAVPMVTVVQLSDLHLGHDGHTHEKAFELWCDWLRETAPDFVVVTGDVSHQPENELSWAFATEQLDRTGVAWAAIPGNHDIARPYPAESAFDAHFGETPRVERVGGVELVLFDTFRYLAVNDRPQTDVRRGEEGHFGHGAVTDEQLAEASKMLSGGRARVACIHHHLHPHRHERGRDEPTPEKIEIMRPLYDRDRFLEWCDEHRVDLILSGHQHAWTPPEFFGGVLNIRGTRCTRSSGVGRMILLGDELTVRDYVLPPGFD